MVSVILISKSGKAKQVEVENVEELHVLAKCKKEKFVARHTWSVQNKNITMYGSTSGKVGNENQYDFPPPMDQVLFFGGCILVCRNDSEVVDLYLSTWKRCYDELFGGFDDCTSEEESEEETDLRIGRHGYAIDDFVVED